MSYWWRSGNWIWSINNPPSRSAVILIGNNNGNERLRVLLITINGDDPQRGAIISETTGLETIIRLNIVAEQNREPPTTISFYLEVIFTEPRR